MTTTPTINKSKNGKLHTISLSQFSRFSQTHDHQQCVCVESASAYSYILKWYINTGKNNRMCVHLNVCYTYYFYAVITIISWCSEQHIVPSGCRQSERERRTKTNNSYSNMPKICENIKRCVVIWMCVCEIGKDFLYLYASRSLSHSLSISISISISLRWLLRMQNSFSPKLFRSMQMAMFEDRAWEMQCNAMHKNGIWIDFVAIVYSSFYYFCCFAFRFVSFTNSHSPSRWSLRIQ